MKFTRTLRAVAMFAYLAVNLAIFPLVLAAKMAADREVAVDASAFYPVAIRAVKGAMVVVVVGTMHVA